MTALLMTLGGSPSAATATPVNLGTAASYGVLAGQSVTNTGPSMIFGDLGVSPGTAVSGFPPGTVSGTIHAANAAAAQAQADLTIAYNQAAGQASDETISADLAGMVLEPGVYTSGSTMSLSGQLTLDALGDPSALFVFQVGSALNIETGSTIVLANGAQACNVFWQVGSSADLKTGSTFVGTILALTSITVGDSVTVDGRLLARNGSVTLINDTITVPTCAPTNTSVPPTSDVPTSDVPTSDVPTSDVPTSDVPTSDVPTSDVPTSDVPTSDVPTSDVPTSDVPTSDVPTSDVPTSDVPIPDQPIVEQPEVDQPKVDQPKVEQLEQPDNQITNVPEGFPNTGDGGSVGQSNAALIGAGSLALILAGGLLILWRRELLTD